MYERVNPNLNFVDREKDVLKFWKERHIFEKSIDSRKEGPTYMFYDGPPRPTASPTSAMWKPALSRI